MKSAQSSLIMWSVVGLCILAAWIAPVEVDLSTKKFITVYMLLAGLHIENFRRVPVFRRFMTSKWNLLTLFYWIGIAFTTVLFALSVAELIPG